MKDFIISIFKTSEERLKNPFIGTFVLSFIAFNWKPILVLIFSNIPIEDRVSYISNNYSDISCIIAYPLLLSFFYVLALPYLMVLIEKSTVSAFKKRKDILYFSRNIDLLGQISVAKNEVELDNLRADSKNKADLRSTIKDLESALEKKKKEIESLETENKKLNIYSENSIEKDLRIQELTDELNLANEEDNQYLKSYERAPDDLISDFLNNLLLINDDSSDSINMIIKKCIDHKLLETDINEYGEKHYVITNKGLAFIEFANNDRII